MIHRSHDLLDGGVVVGTMAEKQIDVFQIEALEGLVETLDDVLPRKAALVDSLASPEQLRRDHQLGSVDVEALEYLAHRHFGGSVSINLGVV